MKPISILQVSYKNFETTTEPCLKSLFESDEFSDMEIILVDNVSGDETIRKIKSLIAGRQNVKLIANQTNRGFPGGANDAIKHASCEHVFFLDIDTVVPSGALRKLSSFLNKNPNWIVGPVTNQTGSEQKIFTQGSETKEILQEGLEWTRHAVGSQIQVKQLDFCCIGMTKKALEQIGPLEEGFGLGYYEDTDFCHRAGKMGFELMMIEEVFVYHKGGGTYLSSKEKMRQSRDFFLKKHGKEGFSSLLRQRDLVIKTMDIYREQLYAGKIDERDIKYRAKSRFSLAKQIMPKNPVKKILYWAELKKRKKIFGV